MAIKCDFSLFFAVFRGFRPNSRPDFFKRCGAGVARPASDNGRFPLSREWGEGGEWGRGRNGERGDMGKGGNGEGMWEGGGCERQRMKRGIPPAKARIAQSPKNIKHSPFPRKRKSSNPPKHKLLPSENRPIPSNINYSLFPRKRESSNPPKHKLLPSENRPIPSNINYSPFPRKRESPYSRANGANYISHEESRKGGKRKVSGRGKCGE